MLKDHSERVCTFFAADYEPQIGFATRLSEAAEAIQGKLSAPHWGFGTGGYLLRVPADRFIFFWTFDGLLVKPLGMMDGAILPRSMAPW